MSEDASGQTDDEVVAAAAAGGVALERCKPGMFRVLKVAARAVMVFGEQGIDLLVRSSFDNKRILRRRYKQLPNALRAIREHVPVNPNGYGMGVRVLATINRESGAGYAWTARQIRERLSGTEGVIVGGVGEPTGNWQVQHGEGTVTWWDEAELTICDAAQRRVAA